MENGNVMEYSKKRLLTNIDVIFSIRKVKIQREADESRMMSINYYQGNFIGKEK